MIFAIYMVEGYFLAGCVGYSLLQTGMLPKWVAWMCLALDFDGEVLYPTGLPLCAPPLMVHRT